MGGVVKTATDVVLGKKDPGTSDQIIDPISGSARALQDKALGKYGDILNQDTSALADQTIANQQNQFIQNAQDQSMRARQEVAKRGLGGTSIGLNTIMAPQAQLGQQVGALNANRGLIADQLNKDNLQFASGGIDSIIGNQSQSKIFKQGQASQGRIGGLAPVLGGVAGALLAPPGQKAQGAQVGMSLGKATSQIF